jgi:hypothetical protein
MFNSIVLRPLSPYDPLARTAKTFAARAIVLIATPIVVGLLVLFGLVLVREVAASPRATIVGIVVSAATVVFFEKFVTSEPMRVGFLPDRRRKRYWIWRSTAEREQIELSAAKIKWLEEKLAYLVAATESPQSLSPAPGDVWCSTNPLDEQTTEGPESERIQPARFSSEGASLTELTVRARRIQKDLEQLIKEIQGLQQSQQRPSKDS